MQVIAVLTMKQIAALSEDELLNLAERSAARLTHLLVNPEDRVKPYFFIRTKNGKKDFKLPPNIEVVISTKRI